MASQQQIIANAAAHYGVPAQYLWGVYGAETNFGRDLSTSSAGAQGPFQFEPGTARSYGVNTRDFTSSAYGAAHLLSDLFKQFHSWPSAIGHYNSGPGGSLTNPETAAYIPKVINYAKGWRGPTGQVSSSAPGGRTSVSGVQAAQIPNPGGTDLASLLQQIQQIRPPHPPNLSYPQPPAFEAHAQMPANYQQVPSASPAYLQYLTQPAGPSATDIVNALQGMGPNTISSPGSAGTVTQGGVPGPHGKTTGGIINRGNLGRTDMGVDFTGSGPINAIEGGTVTRVVPRGGGSGWPGGGFINVRMDKTVNVNGHPVRDFYLAENIDPSVKVGQRIAQGQQLATGHNNFPFLEYGWAGNDQGSTLSSITGTAATHPNHSNTPEGQSFYRYLQALGWI